MEQKTKDKLISIFIIVATTALAMFIFMQFVQWKYKAEFLMSPCGLCTKLNPQFEECFIKREGMNMTQWENPNQINFSKINIKE